MRQSLPNSDETGLSETLTKEANTAVERTLEGEHNGASGKKRKYTHFTPEQRAKIAKYAAQFGNSGAVRHFTKEFPTLGESSVTVQEAVYDRAEEKSVRRRNHTAC